MVSVGVCNQQFQGTDYTFNGLWLPGCRKALLCKHMTRFLLVLLVCYNSAMQCIEYIYMTKKSTWFPEAKPKKAKKYTKYFPFFCYGYFRSFFKCASDFSKSFFHQQRPTQKKTPRPPPPPVLFHSRKKSGLAKGGYSKAPSPNQRASCNPWLVFSFPSKTHYFL